MNKIISFLKSIPFTLAAFGAWGASAGFNAKFGIKMGGDDFSLVVLWVVLFVSLDVLKAGGGVKLREAISSRDLFAIILAAGLLVSGTSFSLLAAFAWRAQGAAEQVAARKKIIDQRKALRLAIEQNRVRAASLQARDLTKIEAELASKRNNRRYRTSEQCQNATLAASRKLCNAIAALEGERSRATERTYRESKIEADEKKLTSLAMPTNSANPMAQSMSGILAMLEIRANPEKLGDLLMAIIAILAEFVSVAGPMLLSRNKKPTQRRSLPFFAPKRKEPKAPETPADGRKLERDEALSWLQRAHQDERVKVDGDTITATNKALAQIFGRPASTVNDWLNAWASEGLIEKRAGATGTRIRITA